MCEEFMTCLHRICRFLCCIYDIQHLLLGLVSVVCLLSSLSCPFVSDWILGRIEENGFEVAPGERGGDRGRRGRGRGKHTWGSAHSKIGTCQSAMGCCCLLTLNENTQVSCGCFWKGNWFCCKDLVAKMFVICPILRNTMQPLFVAHLPQTQWGIVAHYLLTITMVSSAKNSSLKQTTCDFSMYTLHGGNFGMQKPCKLRLKAGLLGNVIAEPVLWWKLLYTHLDK